jgi:hypothetical protein
MEDGRLEKKEERRKTIEVNRKLKNLAENK